MVRPHKTLAPETVSDGRQEPGGPDVHPKSRLRGILGPGLITGASDDDPSGIATYSQAGAQFAYGLGWTMVAAYPLMCAIQMISARIGRVTGHGIAGNLRRHFPPWLTAFIVILLLTANTINIGADLGAMADATALVTGVHPAVFLLPFAAFCAFSEVFVSYRNYVRALKWLTLALMAYVITLFLVDMPWGRALEGLAVPNIEFNGRTLTMIVAIFGTTISPYLFFWQASEEAEDVRALKERHPLNRAPKEGPEELKRIELDTLTGMAAANLVALAIMLTTAATLNANGISDIETSAQAAAALRPLAGPYASTVFALGIVGTGLLAVPVLAGAAAYAVGEGEGWPVGLSRKPKRAKAFYGTIVAATAIGALMNFTPINPISALYWTAVINGIVSVPVMVVMMLISSRSAIMGRFTISRRLHILGWTAALAMAVAVFGMGLSLLRGL